MHFCWTESIKDKIKRMRKTNSLYVSEACVLEETRCKMGKLVAVGGPGQAEAAVFVASGSAQICSVPV
jgi:hypothetical protein